jgi:hypothetical protein
MIKLILFILFFSNCFANETTDSEKFKIELYNLTKNPHRPITYKQANDILFTKLDNHNGTICSVYSKNTCINSMIVPSPKIMNIEHTWPQSEGANGDAKSDLHHIFPVDSSTNSIRSSLPFCDVVTIKWEHDLSKRGFSQFNEHCFEPPPEHKGNVARALFYFSVRYQKSIDQNQEFFLRKWHKEDPIDQNEIDRNQLIKSFQNNSNPFIDNPELVDKISDF